MNSKEGGFFEEIEDHLNEFMSNMCQLYEVQHFKNPEKKIKKEESSRKIKSFSNLISNPNNEKFGNMFLLFQIQKHQEIKIDC